MSSCSKSLNHQNCIRLPERAQDRRKRATGSSEDADDVLKDARHIQKYYTGYFASFDIVEEVPTGQDSHVKFRFTPVGNPSRHIECLLSPSTAYTIIEDSEQLKSDLAGKVFESFEQILAAVMGPKAFAELLSRLVTQQLQ